ncbi:phosphotransferase enzyme family protein [Ornithinimicrobium pratense]|uniref:Uncharacterized protein n=1 Tax=Ornithinimicrobium pratense TaxID=2593973 RepID=A0A5J6V825_9MICO|nr:phosphotransferase [Ornithinimicrobium pratense]QFG69999.1 hypothetical protein FY030_15935 [Ornithinimicrobium pratense]
MTSIAAVDCRLVNAPTSAQLRRSFDLRSVDENSLSPWANVHQALTHDGTPVVVKRTASSQQRADAMASWTRTLADAGITVVTPTELDTSNPQQIEVSPAATDEEADTSWWVVYPFVEGRPYNGSLGDIEAAGDLLGRIHAVSLTPQLEAGLRPYEWPDTVREDVDSDLETLGEVLARHAGDRAQSATNSVRALAERWWTTALPGLRDADNAAPLPRAGVTSDYKASNLVFVDTEPVLVDPDNGGVEPRILDLALALVLFHNECPTAPARLLTSTEWGRFATAYLRHVTLTQRERELWPLAIDHMLWEEGTWVLEDNDDAAWVDTRQGPQLLDLALATPDRYPLP